MTLLSIGCDANAVSQLLRRAIIAYGVYIYVMIMTKSCCCAHEDTCGAKLSDSTIMCEANVCKCSLPFLWHIDCTYTHSLSYRGGDNVRCTDKMLLFSFFSCLLFSSRIAVSDT